MKPRMAEGLPWTEKTIWHDWLAADRRVPSLGSTNPAPAQFCAALALWAAPGMIATRLGLRAVPEALLSGLLRHDPVVPLALAVALSYSIATALLVAVTARQLAHGRPVYVRAGIFLIALPPISLSLAITPILALLCFTGTAILCFPGLL